jgi:hypothetical protein
MKNIIILALVFSTGYLLFKNYYKNDEPNLNPIDSPPPSSPTPPPTPFEQVESVLSSRPIQASSLHKIYSKFPDLVRKQVKNRTIQITGNVKQIMLTGFSKNKAELMIGNFIQPRIVLVDDLNIHKDTLTETSNEKYLVSWEINSSRLYLVTKTKSIGNNNYRGYIDKKTHIFTIGRDLTLECRLREWNASSLYFYCEPHPR